MTRRDLALLTLLAVFVMARGAFEVLAYRLRRGRAREVTVTLTVDTSSFVEAMEAATREVRRG